MISQDNTISYSYKPSYGGHQQGFSLIEVMIATFLIAITLVPAIDALSNAMQGGEIHASQASYRFRLSGKMEEVLAKPFNELLQHADLTNNATISIGAYSDSTSTPQRLLVYLSRYDGDNADSDNNGFTGVDDNLLWVRVTIDQSKEHLETLIGASL